MNVVFFRKVPHFLHTHMHTRTHAHTHTHMHAHTHTSYSYNITLMLPLLVTGHCPTTHGRLPERVHMYKQTIIYCSLLFAFHKTIHKGTHTVMQINKTQYTAINKCDIHPRPSYMYHTVLLSPNTVQRRHEG